MKRGFKYIFSHALIFICCSVVSPAIANDRGHGSDEGGGESSGDNASEDSKESNGSKESNEPKQSPKVKEHGDGPPKPEEKRPRTLEDLKKEITETENPSQEDLESWQKDLERLLAEADGKAPKERSEEENKAIDDIRVLQNHTLNLISEKINPTRGISDPNSTPPSPFSEPDHHVPYDPYVSQAPPPLVPDDSALPKSFKDFAELDLQNTISQNRSATNSNGINSTPYPKSVGGATSTPNLIGSPTQNRTATTSNPASSAPSESKFPTSPSFAPPATFASASIGASFSLPVSGSAKSTAQLDTSFFSNLTASPAFGGGASAGAAGGAPTLSPGGREIVTEGSGRTLASLEPRLLDGGVAPSFGSGGTVAKGNLTSTLPGYQAPKSYESSPIVVTTDNSPSYSGNSSGSPENVAYVPPTTKSENKTESAVSATIPTSAPSKTSKPLELNLAAIASSLWSDDNSTASASASASTTTSASRGATATASAASEIAKSGVKFDEKVMRVLAYSLPDSVTKLPTTSGAAVGSVVRGILLARKGDLSSTTSTERMKPSTPLAEVGPKSVASKMLDFAN